MKRNILTAIGCVFLTLWGPIARPALAQPPYTNQDEYRSYLQNIHARLLPGVVWDDSHAAVVVFDPIPNVSPQDQPTFITGVLGSMLIDIDIRVAYEVDVLALTGSDVAPDVSEQTLVEVQDAIQQDSVTIQSVVAVLHGAEEILIEGTMFSRISPESGEFESCLVIEQEVGEGFFKLQAWFHAEDPVTPDPNLPGLGEQQAGQSAGLDEPPPGDPSPDTADDPSPDTADGAAADDCADCDKDLDIKKAFLDAWRDAQEEIADQAKADAIEEANGVFDAKKKEAEIESTMECIRARYDYERAEAIAMVMMADCLLFAAAAAPFGGGPWILALAILGCTATLVYNKISAAIAARARCDNAMTDAENTIAGAATERDNAKAAAVRDHLFELDRIKYEYCYRLAMLYVEWAECVEGFGCDVQIVYHELNIPPEERRMTELRLLLPAECHGMLDDAAGLVTP